MVEIPKIVLNNGYFIPQVGFGLWKVDAKEAPDVVYEAINAGYRLFDCAFDYGNEKEAAIGIQRAINDGIVKREDLTIVSKLWCTFHERERVEPTSMSAEHLQLRFGPLSFVELLWKKAIDFPKLFDQPIINRFAEKYNKSPAQILLRWATQRGLAVIPKSSNPKRLVENLDCTSFDLAPEDVQQISALNRNIRFNNPPDYLGTLHIFA